MPQAIDRRTKAGFVVSGLWNSLGDVLGAGSFDDDELDNRWSFFFESGCSFGQDFKTLTERIIKDTPTLSSTLGRLSLLTA